MFKLIIDKDGQKAQQLIEVGPGGKYYDPSKVLWDERKDGPVPQSAIGNIGGLVRIGPDLVLDTAKLAQHNLDKTDKESKKQDKKSKLATAMAELDALDLNGALTDSEVKKAVKHLIRIVRQL